MTAAHPPPETPVTIVPLRADDAEELYALHMEVHETLSDARLMYVHGIEFFQALLDGGGAVLGAFHLDKIVAYAAFALPGKPCAGYAEHLAHLTVTAGNSAETAGSAVHPKYRNQGLYGRITAERYRYARGLGITFMASVVSPQSQATLRTMHQFGCAAAAKYLDQDGDNFLFVKPLRHELPGLGDGWQMVGLAELPQAMHFLEAKDHIGLPAPLHGPPAYAFCSLDQAALPWNFKTD